MIVPGSERKVCGLHWLPRPSDQRSWNTRDDTAQTELLHTRPHQGGGWPLCFKMLPGLCTLCILQARISSSARMTWIYQMWRRTVDQKDSQNKDLNEADWTIHSPLSPWCGSVRKCNTHYNATDWARRNHWNHLKPAGLSKAMRLMMN